MSLPLFRRSISSNHRQNAIYTLSPFINLLLPSQSSSLFDNKPHFNIHSHSLLILIPLSSSFEALHGIINLITIFILLQLCLIILFTFFYILTLFILICFYLLYYYYHLFRVLYLLLLVAIIYLSFFLSLM
jgi:hypothetical protein